MMRCVLLLPFPLDVLAILLLVPVFLIAGAIEEVVIWMKKKLWMLHSNHDGE